METADQYFDKREFAIRASFEDRHFWHVHRREVVKQVLDGVVRGRAPRLIEFGCGIGTVATHLNQAGYAVDYSDVFEEGLSIARQRAQSVLGTGAEHRRFVKTDITKKVDPLSDYGGILLLDVIEHLPSAEQALLNLSSALPPRAFALVTVPAFQFLWSPWDEVQKHKRRYTKATLARCLEQGGFRTEFMSHFFSPLFFAALGVKGLRALRSQLHQNPDAGQIDQMAEAKDLGPINVVLTRFLALERPTLRFKHLPKPPFGTSLMAVARKV